jgi:hypothetical protein
MIETQQSLENRTAICQSCQFYQSISSATSWQCNFMGGAIYALPYTQEFSCPDGKWVVQLQPEQQ